MWAALAGGVGGAKLVRGLMALTPASIADLRIIVNTGDDFTHHGLRISPDIDTMLYTLGGIANPQTGWGIAGDTTKVLDQLTALGEDPWFWLGDRDLATHLLRTTALSAGDGLAKVTADLARRLGIPAWVRIMPMSDDVVATEIQTPDGWLPFQEYFVRRRHADPVSDVRFAGLARARPLSAALEALRTAEVVVFCPSNPIVSIGPILALPGMRDALAHHQAGRRRVAVSPIIQGQALKGPADRMLEGLGYEVSALGVARLYAGLVDDFVLDSADADLAPAVAQLGMRPHVLPTIMTDAAASLTLAEAIAQVVQA